jgi:hypothetical protein
MDSLKFNTVDTGDFDFFNFENSKTFTGTFQTAWLGTNDGGSDDVTGLVFTEYGTEARLILPRNYQLEKLFVHQQSETPIDWDKNPVFRITRGADKELKGGKTVATFTFQFAYPEPVKTPEMESDF